jgi:hypothetical protein
MLDTLAAMDLREEFTLMEAPDSVVVVVMGATAISHTVEDMVEDMEEADMEEADMEEEDMEDTEDLEEMWDIQEVVEDIVDIVDMVMEVNMFMDIPQKPSLL